MRTWTKILVVILLCFTVTASADVVVIIQPASICAESYAPSLTADQSWSVGRYTAGDFCGPVYIPASSECVCEIYAHIYSITLTPTNDFHIRIFTVDGNDDVATVVGTSSAVSAADIITAGAGAYTPAFTFSPCVDLTGSTEYAFGVFRDTDANLTDDPEPDGTNYWRWGFDDERNLDGVLAGKTCWTWDASIPYVDESAIDLEDDMLIKVWTQ